MGARRLKILAGPHRGGELTLPESGELSIGSDDACDIVLSDPSLAGRHALLSLAGQQQGRLIPQEGVVASGEARLPAEGEEIVDFRVYSLGETRLSLGPDEGEWPDDEVPENRPPPPEEPPSGEPASEGGEADLEGREPAGEEEAHAAAADPGTRAQKPGRRKAALAALALALALVGLARLIWPAGHGSWAGFQDLLAEAGYAGLTLERGLRGEMLLRGWLDTDQQVARLKELAQIHRPDAVVEVESLRALAAGLNARVRTLGYPLHFIPERGGRLRVRGYAQNAEAAAGMRRALEPELGSFAGDEWEVRTWAELAETLPALASARRLNFLRFEPRDSAVAVTGLQSAPPEAWAAFQEELRDMLGLPLIFVPVSPAPAPGPASEETPPPRAAPPLPPERPAAAWPDSGLLCLGLARDPANPKSLRYAGDGGGGYLEGAVLPGGQRVVSVQPQGVFLERDGLTHYCPW